MSESLEPKQEETDKTAQEQQPEVVEERVASESSIQDAAWVERALAGDERVYKQFMQKYERALYFFIVKMVRDREMIPDLIQEIFVKAFSNLSTFNPQYAFSTWLYRIATNHTIDYLRKKKLNTYSIDEPVSTKDGEMQIELPDNNFAADKEIQHKERASLISQAISSLPEKYQMVIKMRHMEEKSYQEISEILDLPLGTVKAHIFRARELLYKFLKDKQGTF
ncbi:sigma-70 family RNA polymerase sigma factor [bacterium]|nr:MAG: sigma-70 family RNA polymerase sigma factor [bacterium]